jgi:hypothetical protein
MPYRFAAAGVVLGIKAAVNDRGLILNGIVELSPSGATTFYWVLCALSGTFVVASGLPVYVRMTTRQQVILSRAGLSLPRSRWSSENQAIVFGDIRKVELTEVYGQRFAHIFHPGGKATITASMLPRDSDFDEVVRVVTDQIAAA